MITVYNGYGDCRLVMQEWQLDVIMHVDLLRGVRSTVGSNVSTSPAAGDKI